MFLDKTLYSHCVSPPRNINEYHQIKLSGKHDKMLRGKGVGAGLPVMD